jgi:mevalonate kinase
MTSYAVSVPGKTILFGEHAVVYGYPAIAVPLDSISMTMKISAKPTENDTLIINNNTGEKVLLNNLNPDHFYRVAFNLIIESLQIPKLPALQIIISSTIPIASGLGSSAAFAVCLVRVLSGFLGFKLSDNRINEIAFTIEAFQHGTPSGVDNTVVTYKKPVFFRKDSEMVFLDIKKPITLVIADTGLRSVTRETVAEVRIKKDSNPALFNKLLEEIGIVAMSARSHLENGDFEILGKLMVENHHLLQKLGVSCYELDHLVEVAQDNGSFGAKLCGSGKGGNIVAIVDENQAEFIKSALLNNGATNCFISRIGEIK